MIFHVTMEHSEDGWIVAECPALPGCVSQGKDEKEALDNIKEAIIAWLWAEDQKAIAATPSNRGNSPLQLRYSPFCYSGGKRSEVTYHHIPG